MGAVEILYLNISQSLSKIPLERQIHSERHTYRTELFSLIFVSELIFILIYKPN